MIHPDVVTGNDPLLSAAFRPEAEELDALAQALSAERSFAFLIASVTTRRHRQRLEQELSARVATLQPGRRLLCLEPKLKEPSESLFRVLCTAAAEQKPAAILLSGVEVCFAELFSPRGQQVFAQLDSDQEHLAREVACPVLIWLPVPLLYAVLLYAPKLFQAAKVYSFAEPNVEQESLLKRLKAVPMDPQVIAALGEQLLTLTGRPLVEDDLPIGTTITLIMKDAQQRRRSGHSESRIRSEPVSLTVGAAQYCDLGAAAARSGNFQLAVAAYDKAGRMAAERDQPDWQIVANLAQAKAQQKLGHLPEALDAARFALMLAKGFGETELVQKAARSVQRLCQQLAALHREQDTDPSPPAPSARQPTRSSLRALLAAYLLTESAFDMFCLENLLHFAAAHSMALEHGARIELLLDAVAPQQLVAAVSKTATGKELVDGGRLLEFE